VLLWHIERHTCIATRVFWCAESTHQIYSVTMPHITLCKVLARPRRTIYKVLHRPHVTLCVVLARPRPHRTVWVTDRKEECMLNVSTCCSFYKTVVIVLHQGNNNLRLLTLKDTSRSSFDIIMLIFVSWKYFMLCYVIRYLSAVQLLAGALINNYLSLQLALAVYAKLVYRLTMWDCRRQRSVVAQSDV